MIVNYTKLYSIKKVDRDANKADKNPTEKQKKAGNYKLGHVKYAGMNISIENPKGSLRTFKNEDGSIGGVKMKNHYGYFKNTVGKDNDALDVFLGPNENCKNVYIVDQNNKKGNFDESKVMLGFNSKQHAKKSYFNNFNKGWKGFRSITEVPMDTFKKWAFKGSKQYKPASDYKMLNEKD